MKRCLIMSAGMLLGGLLSATALAQTPQVEISGVVEVEASQAMDKITTPGTELKSADVTLARLAFAFDAAVAHNVDTHVSFQYEDPETPAFEVDEATITLQLKNNGYLTVGQMYVPFGRFDTRMVSDPLTLKLAETREAALIWGFEHNGLNASVYGFNGDSNDISPASSDDKDLVYGAGLSYTREEQFEIGIGYISNIADSKILQAIDGGAAGAAGDVTEFVAAGNAYFSWTAGPFTLIAEHVEVVDEFVAGDLNGAVTARRQPSASHGEVVFDLGNGYTLAAAYDSTKELVADTTNNFTGLPRTVRGVTLGVEVAEGAVLNFEYLTFDDYKTTDGGSGEKATRGIIQFTAEF